jgi:hypothetical protein
VSIPESETAGHCRRRCLPVDFPSGIVPMCFYPRMQIRVVLMALVCLVFSPILSAGGKKENKASISFHMETQATDNPKMIFPQMANGQTRYFLRTQEIGTKDIASFSPFPSEVAGDYGLIIQVKSHVINRLAAVTNANQGKWMIAQVNGRVVDGVFVDKQVSDGKLVIWKGISLDDVAILEKELPRTGEEKKK